MSEHLIDSLTVDISDAQREPGESGDGATTREVAASLLETGWRPPARVIDNPADLDALRVGSVIVSHGLVRQKVEHGMGSGWGWTSCGGMSVRSSAYVLEVAGPTVTLLWTPPCYRCGAVHDNADELCVRCEQAVRAEAGEQR
jgi:hypothetical protein